MTVKKEEAKTIWKRMGEVDYRIIYVISMILVAIPLLRPIGVPMTVGAPIKDYAKTIRSLKPGAVVVCYFYGYATMLPDVEPVFMATWKMLLERDCKILVMLAHVDSPSIIEMEFKKLDPGAHGKTYGEDYMFFPYITYEEATLMAFTEDMRSIFKTDCYGTSLDDLDKLPMMENIRSAWDVDLFITSSVELMVRRWVIPYETTMICWGTGTDLLPFVPPFYPESVKGYCGGASQGGELEICTGHLGEGIKYNDAKNLALIGLVAIVIIGNISYFGERLSKR